VVSIYIYALKFDAGSTHVWFFSQKLVVYIICETRSDQQKAAKHVLLCTVCVSVFVGGGGVQEVLNENPPNYF